MSDLTVETVPAIGQIPADQWNALAGDDNPFVEHAFLAALEDTGCCTAESGWLPQHLVVREDAGRPIGVMPLYVKDNSYGEYIFDWEWARAARRAGIRYYPKLTSAVPFTPATGPRLLVCPERADGVEIRRLLARGARVLAERAGAQSAHVLFCSETELDALQAEGYTPRLTFQFHWKNHGYASFDDFLEALTRRRRKEVRRERRKATSSGLDVKVRRGDQLTPEDWDALYRFYRSTVDDHGAIPYLTRGFFEQIASTFSHGVVAVMAYDGRRPVAGTLNFRKGQHLYGRYWGALASYDCLHFECCYYRLIELAIEEGITRVEAGAQGRHKLARGFMPSPTHSAHWLRHQGLYGAVREYLEDEQGWAREQMDALALRSPFRAQSSSG